MRLNSQHGKSIKYDQNKQISQTAKHVDNQVAKQSQSNNKTVKISYSNSRLNNQIDGQTIKIR